jgi:hypothetical protein
LEHGGIVKPVLKTGPNTPNERREIFQTAVDQQNEA